MNTTTSDVTADETILDDPEALAAADPRGMLRAIASSGAQVRQAARTVTAMDLAPLVEPGRPRTVISTGMGGSGIAADVLAALAGSESPVPLITHRGYTLPGWVGPLDLVVGVSCSGHTEETLAVVAEAVRRGCRLLTVGAADTPLAQLSEQGQGIHVPVDAGNRLPRANIWALSIPLLLVADVLGITSMPPGLLASAADLLDDLSVRCRPSCKSFANPAKTLARQLAGAVPMIWGSGEVGSVAAYRFACQLNENANYPAVYGALPEANHNQVVAFDGMFGGGRAEPREDTDLFTRGDAKPAGLRLVLIRDIEEHSRLARRCEVSREIAEEYSVPVSEVVAEGSHPLERLASLIAVTDYASAYLALALGVDPTPVVPIMDVKERIAR